ncbi:hypothetical protein [Candidatus Hydrogenosomobacter endosymbioticus]|uniref:Uncharacterized protein n=1 Tax=Candidatus Hydrogenosomobacter endosymbioticus TaxID=2558174 RepID=A0ABM7V879_9PROT|nr:hypothetical protein [Candidatus Hydrogenosomobacter endosymbioticus]BDB95938.1 hypothetical protein HYD_0710 [Candidatus Hydrogenosomobacter endosymbioticus]
MFKQTLFACALVACSSGAFAGKDIESIMEEIDNGQKQLVVKQADFVQLMAKIQNEGQNDNYRALMNGLLKEINEIYFGIARKTKIVEDYKNGKLDDSDLND